MPNNAAVNDMIATNGYTKTYVAKQLGISRQALSRKLHGHIKWSANDIKSIKELFGLTPKEAFDIFLPEK